MNVAGFIVWTAAAALPFTPFSYIQPIINGGGPGNWFLLGYLLYLGAGVGGFAALSAFLFMIETYEKRTLRNEVMWLGLVLMFMGMTIGCVLLGIAGALGGYTLTIQLATLPTAQRLLLPYVDPITAASLIAVIGAVVSIYGIATAAKATKK